MNPETDGLKAAEILEARVFKDAVANAKARIKDEWTNTTASAQREALWNQFHALDAVERELRTIRDNGLVARHRRER